MKRLLLAILITLALGGQGWGATKIDTTDHFTVNTWGVIGDYFIGSHDNIRIRARHITTGVEASREAFTNLSGGYRINNGWVTSDGKLFVCIWDSATNKYYLFLSIDGGLNFGNNAPTYDDNDYVLILGDTDGSVLNQIDNVNIHNAGFCEATIGGTKTYLIGEYQVAAPYDPVRIMKSTDGATWSQVTKWNAGGDVVRHVHIIKQDPYTGWIWIGLGDTDDHCGIISWDGTSVVVGPTQAFTDGSPKDIVNSATLVGIGGSQKYRTLAIFFTVDKVIWGSDSFDDSTKSGIWKSNKDFTSLERVNNDVANLSCTDSAMGHGITTSNNEFVIMSYLRDNSEICPHYVWVSDDGGNSWLRTGQMTTNKAATVSIFNPDSIYEYNGKTYISTKYGTNPALAGKGTSATIECELSPYHATIDNLNIIHPVWWVSENGTDSVATDDNGGSSTLPWATLNYALTGQKMVNGGRIKILSGAYSFLPSQSIEFNETTYPGWGTSVISGLPHPRYGRFYRRGWDRDVQRSRVQRTLDREIN